MKPEASVSTDEILTRLCKALNEGMDRFEAKNRGNRYKNLVEKHWDAASKAMQEREAEIKQELDRQGLTSGDGHDDCERGEDMSETQKIGVFIDWHIPIRSTTGPDFAPVDHWAERLHEVCDAAIETALKTGAAHIEIKVLSRELQLSRQFLKGHDHENT